MTVTMDRRRVGAGEVVWIALDRPRKANALDLETLTGLAAALDGALADRELAAVVLHAGGRSFCAGLDLDELADRAKQGAMVSTLGRIYELMGSSRVPLVCRVHGPAVGGGLGLVLGCHLALAGPDAWFSTPELTRGLFPVMVSGLLAERVPLAFARRMVLTGERVGPETALSMGIVSHTFESAAALDEGLQQILGLLATWDRGVVRSFLPGPWAGRGMEALAADFLALVRGSG